MWTEREKVLNSPGASSFEDWQQRIIRTQKKFDVEKKRHRLVIENEDKRLLAASCCGKKTVVRENYKNRLEDVDNSPSRGAIMCIFSGTKKEKHQRKEKRYYRYSQIEKVPTYYPQNYKIGEIFAEQLWGGRWLKGTIIAIEKMPLSPHFLSVQVEGITPATQQIAAYELESRIRTVRALDKKFASVLESSKAELNMHDSFYEKERRHFGNFRVYEKYNLSFNETNLEKLPDLPRMATPTALISQRKDVEYFKVAVKRYGSIDANIFMSIEFPGKLLHFRLWFSASRISSWFRRLYSIRKSKRLTIAVPLQRAFRKASVVKQENIFRLKRVKVSMLFKITKKWYLNVAFRKWKILFVAIQIFKKKKKTSCLETWFHVWKQFSRKRKNRRHELHSLRELALTRDVFKFWRVSSRHTARCRRLLLQVLLRTKYETFEKWAVATARSRIIKEAAVQTLVKVWRSKKGKKSKFSNIYDRKLFVAIWCQRYARGRIARHKVYKSGGLAEKREREKIRAERRRRRNKNLAIRIARRKDRSRRPSIMMRRGAFSITGNAYSELEEFIKNQQ